MKGEVASAVMCAVLWAGGCLGPETIWVPLPPRADGTRSLVFVFETLEPSVVSLDVEARHFSFYPGPFEGGERVVAAQYDRTLEELGLRPGAAHPSTSEGRSCRLLAPVAVHSARLENGGVPSWGAEPALLQEEIAMIMGTSKCTKPNLCRSYAASFIELPTTANVFLLQAVDAESAIAADTEGHFFRIREGSYEVVTELEGLPSMTGVFGARGELWLGGKQGRIMRGRLEGTFEEWVLDENETVAAIADAQHRDPFEAYAVGIEQQSASTATVSLYGLNEHRWARLGSERVADAAADRTRILELTGGDILVTYGGPTVLHHRTGAIVSITIPPATFLGVASFGPILLSAEKILLGGSDGSLHAANADAPETWPAITDFSLPAQVRSIMELGSGYLIGGLEGYLGQYFPDGAPCPTEPLANSDADRSARIGTSILVSGGIKLRGRNNQITRLTAVP